MEINDVMDRNYFLRVSHWLILRYEPVEKCNVELQPDDIYVSKKLCIYYIPLLDNLTCSDQYYRLFAFSENFNTESSTY